jgi:hypothetical protein
MSNAERAGEGRKPRYFRRTLRRWLEHWLFGTECPWIYEDVHPIKAWLQRIVR